MNKKRYTTSWDESLGHACDQQSLCQVIDLVHMANQWFSDHFCLLSYAAWEGEKKKWQEKWDNDEERRSWATLQTTTPRAQSLACCYQESMQNTGTDIQCKVRDEMVVCVSVGEHQAAGHICMKPVDCTVAIFFHSYGHVHIIYKEYTTFNDFFFFCMIYKNPLVLDVRKGKFHI